MTRSADPAAVRGSGSPSRGTVYREIVLVFAVGLGRNAVYAIVNLGAALTAGVGLRNLSAGLNGSAAPGRPTLDLIYQLLGVAFALVPVALACHFLIIGGERPTVVLGVDLHQPVRDVTRGAVLALVIGGSGLLLYLAAFKLGASVRLVASSLPAVWWRIPVLILSAAENAVLEETIVLGYLLHRLDQLGWRQWPAVAVSAVIRGSYHLYQGFGGFVGNAVLGVIFGRLYQRWGRVAPMIIAHTLIDSVAFVGYVALHGKLSWLP
jgi:membrane protease YdiL (CAAX protease family)